MRLKMFSIMLACAALARADLALAKAEPNLEKRSEKALTNAEGLAKGLSAQYQSGQWEQVLAALHEIRESVDLSYDSLRQTGKSARKSPKYFKRAELRTRDLGKRLENFAQAVGIDDRPAVEKVRERVLEVHEELLLAIMSKKD